LVARTGKHGASPDLGVLPVLLEELNLRADEEHPDVAVVLEDSWAISIYLQSVVLENVEGPEQPVHARRPADPALVALLEMFVGGGSAAVRSSVEWRLGYPSSGGTQPWA
jgi:hypothetical protein